ncbi:MAG: phage major capsid protein [Ottowia sp.]|nr:phage major capsid protein [Ottowia sp.]
MKKTQSILRVAALALAAVSLGAQAAGLDVAGFFAAHTDVLAGLSMLGMAGTTVEAEYKQVQADLKKVGDDLKAYAEKAEKELKAHSQLSAETKAEVDKLLTAQSELQAAHKAMEQVIAKMQNGGGMPGSAKSLGQMVVENEAITGFNASMRGAVAVKVGSIHAAVTSGAGSAGDLIQPHRVPGIIVPPNQRLFLRDLLNWGTTSSNSIEYVREAGFTNNAAPVAENPSNPKPESDLTFDLDTAPVITIAHYIRASKQVLADVAMLQSYIDGRLLYGLKVKEEAQLLKGSGLGLNLNGILTQATAYVNPGVAVQAETMIDRLRIALLQVELAEYSSDGIVLNPIDWTQIELTKTEDNAYLFATPRGLAAPGLWGRPVVSTQAMDAGEFLTGAFSLGAQGWDREDANITVSNQDRDNFVKNMVTILCEERVGLTVYRPEAFVAGDFSGVHPAPPSSTPASSTPPASS